MLALPWRLLSAGAATVIWLILPILIGTSVAFIAASVTNQAVIRPGTPGPLAAGMVALLLTAWFGPGGGALRRGTGKTIRFAVPGPRARIITWAILALILISALIVANGGSRPDWGPLTGNTVYLQSGSYLAAPGTVEVDSKWGGAKTFFSREGLFMLKCSGVGDLVVSSYGAIQRVDLAAGQSYIVDTGHMVGWEEGVSYEVHKAGNWKATVLGGEGLVVRLTGPGRIYIQTRSPDGFLSWLIPKLPADRS